tara:strand:+ start:13418 stop:13705 length:288 start_codon:yes stop_codon:yes gene_type:complete
MTRLYPETTSIEGKDKHEFGYEWTPVERLHNDLRKEIENDYQPGIINPRQEEELNKIANELGGEITYTTTLDQYGIGKKQVVITFDYVGRPNCTA